MSEENGSEIRSRKWVATLWLHQSHRCLEDLMKDLTDTGRVRFIAYGEEVCPDTGTLHYQAYIVFHQAQQLSRCIRLFGDGHHFEPMYGSLKQNEHYCSKEGSFHKLGDEPKQGENPALNGFKRILEANPKKRPVEVAFENEIHFGTFLKYSRALKEYSTYILERECIMNRDRPKVYIRIGDSGSGKTRWLDERFGLDGWARVPNPTSCWFFTERAAYRDTILIDDIGPTKAPKIEEILEWTDRYPIEQNTKGGHIIIKPKNIVITSNTDWKEWWPNMSPAHKEAFERRIFCVSLVFKDRPTECFYPNNPEFHEVNENYAGYEEETEFHVQGLAEEEVPI